jgi:hypothetical protein
MGGDEKITVRRHWNGAQSALVPVEALWDFHFRNEAGGVCGAFPAPLYERLRALTQR